MCPDHFVERVVESHAVCTLGTAPTVHFLEFPSIWPLSLSLSIIGPLFRRTLCIHKSVLNIKAGARRLRGAVVVARAALGRGQGQGAGGRARAAAPQGRAHPAVVVAARARRTARDILEDSTPWSFLAEQETECTLIALD